MERQATPAQPVSSIRTKTIRAAVPRGRPSTFSAILALLYGIGGTIALAGTIHPLSSAAPTALVAAIGLFELTVSLLLATARRHVGEASLQAALLIRIALVSVMVASLATPTAVVLAGISDVSMALFAAYAFDRSTARLFSMAAAAGFLLALSAGGIEGVVFPSIVIVVAILASGELFGWMMHQLRRQASTDPLTGLANRVSFRLTAEREIDAAARRDLPLTLVMIDLDDFKAVNDNGGHLAGDALLIELAMRWTCELRKSDLLARYGGDEFALLLPATTYDGATAIVNRLHASHPAHWCAGVASWVAGVDLDQLLEQADRELYKAKRRRVDGGGGLPQPRHDRAREGEVVMVPAAPI